MQSALTRASWEAEKKFMNARYRLFRAFPNLMLVLLVIVFGLVASLRPQGYRTTVLLAFVVFLLSVRLYRESKHSAEATLTFVLGMLAVFGLKWDTVASLIFIGFVLVFSAVVFSSRSTRTTTEYVKALVQAASCIDIENEDAVAARLDKIVNSPTNNDQLDILEKAEAVRFLAFKEVPMDTMEDALGAIDLIKSVSFLPLDETCTLFYGLYLVVRSNGGKVADVCSVFPGTMAVPATPNEFLEIFDRSKRRLVSGEIRIADYLADLTRLIESGLVTDAIVEELNKA